MGSVNKVILVGNLGRDAELRYTPGGAPVATLNMATTEVWNDKGGQRQEKTEWHRVVLWGKTAESLSEYLVKGKQIYVEGRLQTQAVGRQGRQQTLHHRDSRRPRRAARRRRRGRRPSARHQDPRGHGRTDGRARLRADGRRYSVLTCDSATCRTCDVPGAGIPRAARLACQHVRSWHIARPHVARLSTSHVLARRTSARGTRHVITSSCSTHPASASPASLPSRWGTV